MCDYVIEMHNIRIPIILILYKQNQAHINKLLISYYQ